HKICISLSWEIFDRRFAVDARQQQRWQQRCRPRFNTSCAFPSHVLQIGTGERVKLSKIIRRIFRMPKTFEQQMIEAEGEIERGIAVACGFSVEEHGALRSAQYILRADVAMHQCNARSCNAIRENTDPSGEIGTLVCRIQQL